MPYMLRKEDGKVKVYKKGAGGKPTGEALGTHLDRASAMQQLKALYANGAADNAQKDWNGEMYAPVKDWDDYISKLSPDDPRVQYDPVGGDNTNACSNCYWYDTDDMACRVVYGDIAPNGLSNMWTRQLTKDERDSQWAQTVRIVGGAKESVPLMEQFKTMLEGFFKGSKSTSETDFSSGFKAFGPDNQYWAAFYTNNAQDRDREWFAEKAHDAYVDDVDSGEWPMPLLDFWHTKAFHGQAFWVDRIGHIMLAVGKFDNSPLADGMKEYYSKNAGKLLVSHGFLFDPMQYKDRTYYDYHSFEISPLPAEIAANEHTGFVSLKEFEDQMLTAEKKKGLETALGPELASKLFAAAGEKSAQLEKVATAFKDTGNPLETRLKSLEDKFDLTLEALSALTTGKKAAKKPAEGSDAEEADESDSEAAAEGDKPKKGAAKKEQADPMVAILELAKAVQASNKNQELLAKSVNAIYQEISNPQSAQRSQYTVVPPDDPAMAALKARMEGNGDQNAAPNSMPDTVSVEDYGATIFGPGLFKSSNGHGV